MGPAALIRLLLLGVSLLTPPTVALAQERLAHPLGELELMPTTTRVVIAAPHGTFDVNTASLAIDVAGRLGAGYVVARRFSADKIRINVNRPTEGAGLACAQEPHTERAKDVYDLWTRAVGTAGAGRPLRLYVEIHGNSNPRAAQAVEIASRGLSLADAKRLKEGYVTALARARAHAPTYPELGILLEPVDPVFFVATCAKKFGILSTDLTPHALHLEFPRAVRTPETLEATGMLVIDLVRQFLNSRSDAKD